MNQSPPLSPMNILANASIKNCIGQTIACILKEFRSNMRHMSESGRRRWITDLLNIVSDEAILTLVSMKNNVFYFCCYNVMSHPLFYTNVQAAVDACLKSLTAQYLSSPNGMQMPKLSRNMKPSLDMFDKSSNSNSRKKSFIFNIPKAPPKVGTTKESGKKFSAEDAMKKNALRKIMIFSDATGLFAQPELPSLTPEEKSIQELNNVLSKGSEAPIPYFRKLPQKRQRSLARQAKLVTKRLRTHEPVIFKILSLNTTKRNKDILMRNYQTKINKLGGERSKASTWLKTIESIPFGKKIELPGKRTTHKKLLSSAAKILDSVTYGQVDVKRELLKLMGQLLTRGQNPSKKSSPGMTVIAVNGPPGVGKTTLIQHGLAKILGRPFNVIPLGGAVDSSYLVGHNYTYEGSRWGRIVDSLIESKCMNPVIFFEELDKVSETRKGQEIMNLLMHLTDPCQSHRFQDRYFGEIDFDLSDIIIVFSLNSIQKIDRVLLDRLQLINVKPFTIADKVQIAQKFLIPECLKHVGLSEGDVAFPEKTVRMFADQYTSEAGVRRLKECINFSIRELNVRRIESVIKFPVQVTPTMISDDLFKKKIPIEYARVLMQDHVGYCVGLWANSFSDGGICPIEVSMIPKTKALELELTGCQGKVMKESMHCARTVAWNLLPQEYQVHWNSKWKTNGAQGFHIHVPSGAVPKDGPSAGVAITLAILSILTDKPIRRDVAFTGEINLKGMVGRIGGLQSKLTGASRAGVTVVGYPESNDGDLQNVDTLITDSIKTYPLKTIHDAIGLAFADTPFKVITNSETKLN